MAVFTTDRSVRGIFDGVILILVALRAGFGGFILYPNQLPLRFIGLAVPPIHVAAFLDTKISRNEQCPNKENADDNRYDNEQWP